MKISVLLFSIGVLAITSACTSFPMQRSSSSGYKDYRDSDMQEVSLRDIRDNSEFSSRPLSPRETNDFQNQSQRKSLEATLVTPEEKKQYLRYRPYLNESERVEFLQLEDIYSRERWVQSRGVGSSSERYNRNIASLVEDNDIALGMQKEAVRDSWGDPDYVEVSGNPKFENERWRFSVPIQTSEGYQMEERLVYFENGRVVGWSTR